jgi:hypothetical protein
MVVEHFLIPYARANARSTVISTVSHTSVPSSQAPIQRFHWLIGNSAHGWQLVQPLQVKVEQVGGDFVISEPRLNVYGIGKTFSESVADFTSMLVDLFEELSASENVLSHHLCQQLEILRTILAPR